MKRGKRIVPVVALAASLSLLAACGTDNEAAPKDDGTTAVKEGRPLVVWAGSQTPIAPNFNPYAPTVLHAALGGVYETLFHFNKASAADPQPMLGESAEFNADGTELTIKIRQGVKWNDGTDFTADDVVFSYTNEAAKPSYLKTAEKVDDSTVKLTFDGPQFTNEFALLGSTYMVPEASFGKEDLVKFTNAEKPVGTGPYILDVATDASYTMKANPNYWQEGKPQVQEVQYIGIDANNSAESLLLTGQLDWAGMFVPQPEALTADGRLGYINTPMDPTVLYTCSNVDLGCKGSQTDVAVRQALNAAIDRTVVKDKAFVGLTKEISPTFALLGRDDMWIADGMPKESPQTANAAEAGKILEAAGYAKNSDGIYEKDGKPVSMTLASVDGWSDYNSAAELIQAQAKDAGIDIKPAKVTWDEFSDGRQSGNYELIMGGMIGTSVADPFQLYRDWFSGGYTKEVGKQLDAGHWNFSRYDNKVVNDAVVEAASTNDEAKKKAAYATIQGEITRDLPYIPLVINATQTFYDQNEFAGWPTEDNLYAFPPSWGSVSAGVVLANLTYK
ncbi:ABC transporter substrate-binding protein [Timonella sp. A28]|uniref:ABC transporter substrate-binding protein n=1 Tax=Timonella sp. A28 TaxID=3442640 RepID=UPI003EC02626